MIPAGIGPSTFPRCAEELVGERARARACSFCRERAVSGYQEIRAVSPGANSNLLWDCQNCFPSSSPMTGLSLNCEEIVNTSPCAQRTERPNWNIRVWSRKRFIVGPLRRQAAHVLKSLEFLPGFRQSTFKSQVRERSCRVCDQLCTVLCLADEVAGRCHRGEHYESLGARRRGGMCSWSSNQVVSIFYLLKRVGGFTSAKQLRKSTSNTIS